MTSELIIILKNYLVIILLFNTGFFCADKAPEIKINNQSQSIIDAHFTIVDCSCPSIVFLDIYPKTETSYRECSITKYSVRFKMLNEDIGSELFFQPEINKKYQIVIDSSFNYRLNSFDR